MAAASKKTGSGSRAGTGNTRSSSKKPSSAKTTSKTASKTGKKSSTAKKKTGTASGKTKNVQGSSLGRDMFLLLIIFAGVVLMMSALGFGGFVGNTISTVMFGTMGYMFYAFPAFLLVFAWIASTRKHFALNRGFKLLSLFLLFILMCGFIEIVSEGTITEDSLMKYYYAAADSHVGGGLIGAAVSKSVTAAFGEAGALVVLILVIVCCTIELTQQSFFGFLYAIADGITLMIESSREMYDEREPERELKREIRDTEKQRRKEERRALRMQQLEDRKAELDEIDVPADDDPEDEEIEEDGPVIGDRKKPLPEKNPKIDKFPGKKQDLDVPLYDQNEEENENMRKARKAIRRQKSQGASRKTPRDPWELSLKEQEEQDKKQRNKKPGAKANEGFLEETWLKGEDAGSPEEPEETVIPDEEPVREKNREEMRKISDDLVIKRAPQKVDEWDEPEDDGEDGWTMDDAMTAMETSASRKKSRPRQTEKEKEEEVASIENQIAVQKEPPKQEYVFPPLRLLKRGSGDGQGDSDEYIRATAQKLQDTLYNFGVNATVSNVSCGPTVTRFELTPEMGVKVSKIVGLADDIKLNLACADIRIEAPIPGKSAVGIEVPNKENSTVMLRDLLETDAFQKSSAKLSFAVGKDIGGKPVVADIAKMPHVLIAGATGSGKSVCINTLIMSILYKASPDEVKLIMIDPKVVELSVYNGIPHLFIPVVTDPKKAAGALNWAVSEMSSRYNTFAEYGVRNLKEYNHKVKNLRLGEGDERPPKMPQIVIIVDELADLMMVAPGDVEDAICRLAQLARAAGIHLVIATQRPSVNVITGLIKANMPSRIAFAVASGVDSRTILDMNGAEKLLGKGDMLFYPQGYPKPARLQGSFVSDEEVSAVVDYLTKKNPAAEYDPAIQTQMNSAAPGGSFSSGGEDRDAYFAEAGRFIIEKDKASIGMLQRMFKIGFNRAARIMDQLADAGVVGPEEGTKPRRILMTMEQFENYLEENG